MYEEELTLKLAKKKELKDEFRKISNVIKLL